MRGVNLMDSKPYRNKHTDTLVKIGAELPQSQRSLALTITMSNTTRLWSDSKTKNPSHGTSVAACRLLKGHGLTPSSPIQMEIIISDHSPHCKDADKHWRPIGKQGTKW